MFRLYRAIEVIDFFKQQLLVKILVVVILCATAVAGFFYRDEIYSSYKMVLEQTLLAPFAFVIFYSLACVFFLPTLPLNILAGFLWGAYIGTVYSLIGSSIGASLSFLIGRFLARDFCLKKLRTEQWMGLLSKIEQNDWKILALAKLNPILPSNVISYLFSVSSISLKRFFWIGTLFVIPPTFAVSLLGSVTHDSFISAQGIIWKFSFVVSVFTILLVVHKVLWKKKVSISVK